MLKLCDKAKGFALLYQCLNILLYRICCLYSQSYPSGSPDRISPSVHVDKLDFQKLSAHAKQYRQKCGISETAQQWWNDYLPKLQQKCSDHQDAIWPLQDLIDCARRSSTSTLPSPVEERASIEVDVPLLPSHLQALYRKENGPHPEVILACGSHQQQCI